MNPEPSQELHAHKLLAFDSIDSIVRIMAQLLVRKVPDELVRKLKQRARQRGVSTEEEHRRILSASLNSASKPNLVEFLLGNEVLPDVELDLSRSKATEARDNGF